MFEGAQGSDGLTPIHRYTPQRREKSPYSGEGKELLLGEKVEALAKRKAHKGNVRPKLVFRKNNGRTRKGQICLSFDRDLVKNGKDNPSDSLR